MVDELIILMKAVIQFLGDLIHGSDSCTRERIDSVKVLTKTFVHFLGNAVSYILPIDVLADGICAAVFKRTAEVIGLGTDKYVDVFVFPFHIN